ncbi:hypothetical protein GCM10017687_43820 [Streptomyces echinatus]
MSPAARASAPADAVRREHGASGPACTGRQPRRPCPRVPLRLRPAPPVHRSGRVPRLCRLGLGPGRTRAAAGAPAPGEADATLQAGRHRMTAGQLALGACRVGGPAVRPRVPDGLLSSVAARIRSNFPARTRRSPGRPRVRIPGVRSYL